MLNTNAASVPVSLPLATGNGFGNSFFGGEGLWAVIILAIIFGWNNGGFGGFGGGQNTSVYEGYVLNNDFSQLSAQLNRATAMTERKLDSISNGICSLGYDQLNQMNGINNNILTTGNALQAAVKDCCCQTQQNIKDTQYVIADKANMVERAVTDGFCQTNFNAATNARDIIDSQTRSTQAILSRIDAMENSRKDEKIAEQACIINNQYLLSQINKTPVPAYVVQNPYCNCNCNQTVGYFGGTTIA